MNLKASTAILLLIACFVGMAVIIGLAETAHKAEVQRVCDVAHNEINGRSEQACGDIQDKYKMEYLCSSIGDHCWVEVK